MRSVVVRHVRVAINLHFGLFRFPSGLMSWGFCGGPLIFFGLTDCAWTLLRPVVADTFAFHWFVRAARGAP